MARLRLLSKYLERYLVNLWLALSAICAPFSTYLAN